MRVLRVEFQTKKSLRPHLILGLTVLAIAFFVVQLLLTYNSHLELQDLQSQSARIEEKSALVRSSRNVGESNAPYREGAEAALNISGFPIELALAELEAVSVPGVRVVSLNLKPIEHTAVAELEAQSEQVLATYISMLTRTETSSAWKLISIGDSNSFAAAPGQQPSGYPSPMRDAATPPTPGGIFTATLQFDFGVETSGFSH